MLNTNSKHNTNICACMKLGSDIFIAVTRMWYHMYGQNLPTLQRNIKSPSSEQKRFWWEGEGEEVKHGGNTFFKMSVSFYQTTWHHTAEDDNAPVFLLEHIYLICLYTLKLLIINYAPGLVIIQKSYHHNTHKELYIHLNLHSFQLVSIPRPSIFSKIFITDTMAEYTGFTAINSAVSDIHQGNNKKLISRHKYIGMKRNIITMNTTFLIWGGL